MYVIDVVLLERAPLAALRNRLLSHKLNRKEPVGYSYGTGAQYEYRGKNGFKDDDGHVLPSD
jgi:hypothetical protein